MNADQYRLEVKILCQTLRKVALKHPLRSHMEIKLWERAKHLEPVSRYSDEQIGRLMNIGVTPIQLERAGTGTIKVAKSLVVGKRQVTRRPTSLFLRLVWSYGGIDAIRGMFNRYFNYMTDSEFNRQIRAAQKLGLVEVVDTIILINKLPLIIDRVPEIDELYPDAAIAA